MAIKKIQCIQDIFDLERLGATGIAYKLQVHTRTVEYWSKRGIPDKYWSKLFDLYGILPSQCFNLNAKLRGYDRKLLKGE